MEPETETWVVHRLPWPGFVGMVVSADKRVISLDQFGEMIQAMTEAALKYLKDNDLMIETDPPAPEGLEKVVEVDFKRKKRK